MSDSYGATQRLLQHNPDAIFLPTRIVLDVLRVLREANLQVPGDIALIGFEDLPLAQQTDPPLTTVSQPMGAIGKHLVGMLLDIMEHGADPPRRLIFPQELIIRQLVRGDARLEAKFCEQDYAEAASRWCLACGSKVLYDFMSRCFAHVGEKSRA